MHESRPHIIFIITDQQRYDTIAALGFDYVDTPNLDRLVNEGVTFTNCHVTAPSCAPSRASLFTGYYPHTTGILKNADRWRHSWIELLAGSGYYCVNVGKMHTFPFETDLGFHERYVVENKDRYLEGRYYFDEWDKGLRALGLVKQQRESYRKLSDYKTCLGPLNGNCPRRPTRTFSWAIWPAGGSTRSRPRMGRSSYRLVFPVPTRLTIRFRVTPNRTWIGNCLCR